MFSQLKDSLIGNLKNSWGWKTRRKIVVFSVDDYGNVRVNSKAARANMDAAGMKIYSRFDLLDTLETKADLAALFTVLDSVKDKNGKPAVFTPFALPCNIDFERLVAENYRQYRYELLPETYKKLTNLQPNAYEGTWELWKDGIAKGFLKPQFHGREHINLTIFNEKLKNKDAALRIALENRSFTSIDDEAYPTMFSTAAFDFWNFDENKAYAAVIEEGLEKFAAVYGYRSNYFTPPVFNIHHSLYPILKENGIQYIDLGLVRSEHQGLNVFKKEFNYTGKKTREGLTIVVRNVVFEPTEDRGIDWVAYTMKQIERAFRWNRPAIISSHRVNFCGHMDVNNREKGLTSLKALLDAIVRRWPEVEFMAADELGDLISKR